MIMSEFIIIIVCEMNDVCCLNVDKSINNDYVSHCIINIYYIALKDHN